MLRRIAHLGGWQRVGTVLSVLWVVIAIIDAARIESRWVNERFEAAVRACGQTADYSSCMDKTQQTWSGTITTAVVLIVVMTVVPIPFFWLVAYILIATLRWVRRGFDAASPPSTS
jgi:hypothetical protein